jgi:hypothetical protein
MSDSPTLPELLRAIADLDESDQLAGYFVVAAFVDSETGDVCSVSESGSVPEAHGELLKDVAFELTKLTELAP